MKKLILCGLLSMSMVAVTSSAIAKSYTEYVDNPQTVGKSRLEVMFWDIYDAELLAKNGKFDMEQPFVLKLTYLRKFEGDNIASRSIDEMRDLGVSDEIKLAKWFEKMRNLFPDVKEGDSLTGVKDSEGKSHFFFNGELVGTVEDPEFSKWFFSIWLSEDTSEPKMRRQLLGLN